MLRQNHVIFQNFQFKPKQNKNWNSSELDWSELSFELRTPDEEIGENASFGVNPDSKSAEFEETWRFAGKMKLESWKTKNRVNVSSWFCFSDFFQ